MLHYVFSCTRRPNAQKGRKAVFVGIDPAVYGVVDCRRYAIIPRDRLSIGFSVIFSSTFLPRPVVEAGSPPEGVPQSFQVRFHVILAAPPRPSWSLHGGTT